MTLTELGNGSWILGILMVVFSFIGLINVFAAFMMWLKEFLNILNQKAKSYFWFWFTIIVVTFGWYALFELIIKLAH